MDILITLAPHGGNHKMTKAKMKTKPKPKPKSNNRRVRRRRPTNNVGGMVNANFNQAKRYMDPEGKTEAPASTTSLGNFTTVNSILRQAVLTSGTADTNVYVIVQYTITQRDYFIIHGNLAIHQL